MYVFFSCKKKSAKVQKVRSCMNDLKEELCSAIETMARYSSCSLPLELTGLNGMFLGSLPMTF